MQNRGSCECKIEKRKRRHALKRTKKKTKHTERMKEF